MYCIYLYIPSCVFFKIFIFSEDDDISSIIIDAVMKGIIPSEIILNLEIEFPLNILAIDMVALSLISSLSIDMSIPGTGIYDNIL
jgi:hypothetical protein